nr:probable inactive poly [ADP-ribose] polymerase SRO5 [Ipomoea batatas]
MENRAPQRKLKIVAKTQPLLAPTTLKRCSEVEDEVEEEHSCTGSSSSVTDHNEQRNCRLIGVEEGNREHQIMEQKLVLGLRGVGMHAAIGSIEKNEFSSSVMKRAKLQSFSLFAKAVEEKSGFGNGNMQFAWLGASKKELTSILQHGFDPSMNKDGSFGHGVYLRPDHFPLGCLNSTMADENGMRHVLYCRVILGKTELVRPGSTQWHPSSQEFDCGVDDLVFPKKYIVWSTNINTHILPFYIISFTISSLNAHNFSGVQRNMVSPKKPNSPRITFPSLVIELEKFLPPQIMQSITTYVKDHREGKITRLEMVKRLRRLAGDELIIKIVKAQKDMVCDFVIHDYIIIYIVNNNNSII